LHEILMDFRKNSNILTTFQNYFDSISSQFDSITTSF
jgi:hypothetical protein